MSVYSAIDALRAKLDGVFAQVQATRQVRDELEIDLHILHKQDGFDALVKADIAYRTIRDTYWNGIEELHSLLNARDAQEAEAARATQSTPAVQSN